LQIAAIISKRNFYLRIYGQVKSKSISTFKF